MNKRTSSLVPGRSHTQPSLRRLTGMLLAAILGGGLVAACATSDAPTDTTESELASCCSDGTFLCRSNPNIEVDYAPPGCGAATKPRAKTLCDSQCGAPCADSGWQPSGLCN
jgi:hypothetical protein